MLTKFGTPVHVIGWTNFLYTSFHYMDFSEISNVSLDLSDIHFARFRGC